MDGYERHPGAAGRASFEIPDVVRGWASFEGSDPLLGEFRSAAMRRIEDYSRDGTLNAAATDRLDAVLRMADPDATTAQYIAAVGDPAYRSAFGKLLRDPQFGLLRYTPDEVRAVQAVTAAQARDETRPR